MFGLHRQNATQPHIKISNQIQHFSLSSSQKTVVICKVFLIMLLAAKQTIWLRFRKPTKELGPLKTFEFLNPRSSPVLKRTVKISNGFAMGLCYCWGVQVTVCHRGGLGSTSAQFMWDLWCTRWHSDRFFSQYFSFPCHYSTNAPHLFSSTYFIFIVPCIVIFYGITNWCHNVQWSFISLQVHSTCFGRHTRPSSGVQS